MTDRDWLVDQLPRVMAEDPFINGYTHIAQDIATSIREEIEKVGYVLDTRLAPLEFVQWIGGWLGVTLESAIGDPQERETRIRRFVETVGLLFLQRGTRAGLEGMLTAMTGNPARVIDAGGGVFRTGQAPANSKHLVVQVRDAGGIDEQTLLHVVQQEVPVDVTFDLEVGVHRIVEQAPAQLGRLEEVAHEATVIEAAEQAEHPSLGMTVTDAPVLPDVPDETSA